MSDTNLKKIAAQLNISVSTVSRALRDSHEIGATTKQKVKALADQLHYMPNPYAGSLRRQRTKNIALIVPEVANSFFSQAINGIEAVAQEKGYHVLIYLTHDNIEKETAIVRQLMNGRVDGMICSLSGDTSQTEHLENLRLKNLPFVLFDRVLEGLGCSTIITDDYECGYQATAHLINAGCKRIAFLSISEHLYISGKRMVGYRDALHKYGIPFEDGLVIMAGQNITENKQLILRALEQANRPDGIFASVERLAIATYHACNELHLSIPGDVKVIGFSNLETASLLNPGLSTLTQPAFEMGKEAASMLFRSLDKKQFKQEPEKLVLRSTLIARGSTGG